MPLLKKSSFQSKVNLLLFVAGHGSDYILVQVSDGGVTLTINIMSGKLDTAVKPRGLKFNDNHWHQVTVTRVNKQVNKSKHLSRTQ